jgi:hypothetical protein
METIEEKRMGIIFLVWWWIWLKWRSVRRGRR